MLQLVTASIYNDGVCMYVYWIEFIYFIHSVIDTVTNWIEKLSTYVYSVFNTRSVCYGLTFYFIF